MGFGSSSAEVSLAARSRLGDNLLGIRVTLSHLRCLRRIGLGPVYLAVCFLYKSNPNPRKKQLLCEKSGPNATFEPNFDRVGLALDWRKFRRFHSIIFFIFSDPTEFSKSQTPYQVRCTVIAVGESGPSATFNLIFLGLGWPWVGGSSSVSQQYFYFFQLNII